MSKLDESVTGGRPVEIKRNISKHLASIRKHYDDKLNNQNQNIDEITEILKRNKRLLNRSNI